ncbi:MULTISPECIES: TolC family protein [unclassified Acinetobacter]|uniref:TolC family protein n=1 Tax=unclassified Acinetobacter TaxID=196816 RepID=UPI0024472728|nr:MULTISPECIES: TolC family protein [unclassified Acinetobacter]MDH0030340.1 TolC family protein [Acinetobacter sp. GD04021]MDH0885908.1 TolC family protein [Acinetobacter sp. GD03873]MDH1082528.1 TolC family protein [Acinetobacter sp. GD03983]MDH2189080.1 TolC family protein [Acinetobacter sp. GD03645]MDH2202268.1 TolC family protein [Acinetobacter sp. GD03647]
MKIRDNYFRKQVSKYQFAICFGILLLSSSVNAMTLDEALSASLKHESQLEMSRLSVNQSTAMLEQARQRDGLKLNLVGQLDYERVETPTGVMFPTEGNRKGRSLQLQLDYPVYTSGRHRLGIEVAKNQLSAQSQGLSDRRSETILNTVMVYTDVLKKQAILELRKKTLANLQRSLYESQRRFDVGMITRADLAQVLAQVAQGQADVTQAQSNLSVSEAQFYQITGEQPDRLVAITNLPKISSHLDDILTKTKNHPALIQAKYEKQAVEKQYALVKRELWPTVMLTSRAGSQHEASYIGSESNNYMVGVQLNVPLYDDGLNRANIKKAQADVELAKQKIKSLELDLNQRAQTTYAQLRTIQQNKDALKNAIDAASIALVYTRKEFELGTKTTFDLLNTEQKLLDVQTQQTVNEQDEVVFIYQLLDQMGDLNDLVSTQHQQQGIFNDN